MTWGILSACAMAIMESNLATCFIKLDNHADATCIGWNVRILARSWETVDVAPFLKSLGVA